MVVKAKAAFGDKASEDDLSEAQKAALEKMVEEYTALGERCTAELEALLGDEPELDYEKKDAGHAQGITFASCFPHTWVIPLRDPQARVGLRGMPRLIASSDMAGCMSPDAARVLTIDMEYAYVWDARSGQLLLTLPIPEPPAEGEEDAPPPEPLIFDASFSSDGARVITTAKSGECIIYDARSGAFLH